MKQLKFLIFLTIGLSHVTAIAGTTTTFLTNTNLQCLSTAYEKTTGVRPSEKYLYLLANVSNQHCFRDTDKPDNCQEPMNPQKQQWGRKYANFSDQDYAWPRLQMDMIYRMQIFGVCTGKYSSDANATFHFRDDESGIFASQNLTATYRPDRASFNGIARQMGFKNPDDAITLFDNNIYKNDDLKENQIRFDSTLGKIVSNANKGGKADPTQFGGICIADRGNWLKECLNELNVVGNEYPPGKPRVSDAFCKEAVKSCNLNPETCNIQKASEPAPSVQRAVGK